MNTYGVIVPGKLEEWQLSFNRAIHLVQSIRRELPMERVYIVRSEPKVTRLVYPNWNH